MMKALPALQAPARASARRLWRRWSGRELSAARERARAILDVIPPLPGVSRPSSWTIQRSLWTDTEVAVLAVGPFDRPPVAILKLLGSQDGAASLQRHYAALTALHRDPRLEGWREILPEPLTAGTIASRFYLAERALPGGQAQDLLAYPTLRRRMQHDAARAIGELHRRTARSVVVDARLLERWVAQPLSRIRHLWLLGGGAYHKAIDRLSHELHEALLGRELAVSWIHGDLWPGNLLVQPASGELTGIVDWDMAAPDELPTHDLLHLLLYTRSLVQRRDLGEIVRAQIESPTWERHEAELLAALAPRRGDALPERILVLLYWLRHIASNLVQSPHYALHPLWIRKNIQEVLRSI